MKTLLSVAVMLLGMSVLADELVNVASLEVKERIQTMERINVSAPSQVLPERPTSIAVAEMLEEATQIEDEDEDAATRE